MPAPAYSNSGSATQNAIGVRGHERSGGPDLGEGQGAHLSNLEMQHRKHFVQPAFPTLSVRDGELGVNGDQARAQDYENLRRNEGLPYYMGNYDGLPVPYSAPSEQKEHMMLKSAIREAAGAEMRERVNRGEAAGVTRTDPITESEVQYLKSMKDQSELAKFDDYVESLVDPRMPGNMKFLMEIYPQYVERRLQQAHTDYEYALRNQMIDSWGINTFDDLHFKYLVDQGKIQGPQLLTPQPAIDSTYTPGLLSPFNFQSPDSGSMLRLPFASAVHGKRSTNADGWKVDRSTRPLGLGNTVGQLAQGMYDTSRTSDIRTGPEVPPSIGANPFSATRDGRRI